ncbi:putative arginyl-tRNA--protein transferase [Thalassotalea insulae]|uniref:Aspartate/glutamate leucyltransferase n=1 Tax=Thalassotalea insulae TaxID=2056778 RepID=A0ABQ6GZW2_9GAMM|nr:arginyltransferase [Thalassotalea insulae]GLX80315.1 putative arginyl-tRNA--protein transferase [Thalassotalea insulae]
MNKSYQLAISQTFPCNYLPEQQERLLIAIDKQLQSAKPYAWLMSQGFRRSGDQIYRPHCINCHACQSLRILAQQFTPSKSQKRIVKKNSAFSQKINNQMQENYYPLYEEYISKVHADGTMYPPNYQQYQSFIECHLIEQIFIETWHREQLISVAVTDILENALSAVYTFYHPDYRSHGLGVYSILTQIEIAKNMGKEFLYLGYHIEGCQKMNYKNKYYPHQILTKNTWLTVNK